MLWSTLASVAWVVGCFAYSWHAWRRRGRAQDVPVPARHLLQYLQLTVASACSEAQVYWQRYQLYLALQSAGLAVALTQPDALGRRAMPALVAAAVGLAFAWVHMNLSALARREHSGRVVRAYVRALGAGGPGGVVMSSDRDMPLSGCGLPWPNRWPMVRGAGNYLPVGFGILWLWLPWLTAP